jgi:starch synthase
MYSMRYGTLPLVRATGGLEDTVINYNPDMPEHCTGFKFWDLNPDSLANTILWASDVYTKYPDHFEAMKKCSMTKDFSWNHTAKEYEQLYKDAYL